MPTLRDTRSKTWSHEEADQNSLLEPDDAEGTISNHVLQVFDTYTVCFGIDELEEPSRKQRRSKSSDKDSDGLIAM